MKSKALILDGLSGNRIIRIPIKKEEEADMIEKLRSIGVECLVRNRCKGED